MWNVSQRSEVGEKRSHVQKVWLGRDHSCDRGGMGHTCIQEVSKGLVITIIL